MHKVVFSPLANTDLTDIGDYIASDLQNPASALRLILKIKKVVGALEQFPEMGTMLDANNASVPYRYIICGNYMVFYHVDEVHVMIDRILYGRRDYLTILFGDKVDADD